MCCEPKCENSFNNTRSCVYCVAFSELRSGKQTTEGLICQLLDWLCNLGFSYVYLLSLYSYVYAYDYILATQ